MEKRTILLTDDNAEQEHHFRFALGERVRSKVNVLKGVVKNAKLEGEFGSTGGFYEIKYHIETDNGDMVEIPMSDLEKA